MSKIRQTGIKKSHQAQGIRNGMYTGVSVFRLSSNQARNKLLHRVSRKDSRSIRCYCWILQLTAGFRYASSTTMWTGESRLSSTNVVRSPPEVGWPLAGRFPIVVNATRLVAGIFLHKCLSIECLAYFVIVKKVSDESIHVINRFKAPSLRTRWLFL